MESATGSAGPAAPAGQTPGQQAGAAKKPSRVPTFLMAAGGGIALCVWILETSLVFKILLSLLGAGMVALGFYLEK